MSLPLTSLCNPRPYWDMEVHPILWLPVTLCVHICIASRVSLHLSPSIRGKLTQTSLSEEELEHRPLLMGKWRLVGFPGWPDLEASPQSLCFGPVLLQVLPSSPRRMRAGCNGFITSRDQKGFPGGASSKGLACQCRTCGFDPWVEKISWSREWQHTPVFLPGEFHG